jgi:hypothetical protein
MSPHTITATFYVILFLIFRSFLFVSIDPFHLRNMQTQFIFKRNTFYVKMSMETKVSVKLILDNEHRKMEDFDKCVRGIYVHFLPRNISRIVEDVDH